jgi:GcrA cell cycle regulator
VEASSSPPTESFRATLGALGQRRVAQLFGVGERTVRRWRDGSRRVPCGAIIVFHLLATKAITIAQAEQAVIAVPVRNGRARPEPPAPCLVEPAPEQSASLAEKVWALEPNACRWPCGDPKDPGFCFCTRPIAKEFYCEAHARMAHMVLPTGGERDVVARTIHLVGHRQLISKAKAA